VADPGVRGAGPAGPVALSWGPACNEAGTPGQDLAVYRGDLGAFDDYTGLTCSTSRRTDHVAEDPAGESFYLVVPQTTAAEGRYGRTGAGAERLPATSPCRPQDPGTCP